MSSDPVLKAEDGTEYFSLSPSPTALSEAGPSRQQKVESFPPRLTHEAIQQHNAMNPPLDEKPSTFATAQPPLKVSPSFAPLNPSMGQDLHTFHNGRQAQLLSHQAEVNVKPNPQQLLSNQAELNVKPNPQQFIYSGQGSSSAQMQNGPKKEVKSELTAIDLTKDGDDDITLVSAKGPSVLTTDPRQVICIGVICASMVTQYGIPDSLTMPYLTGNLSEVNAHPRWHKKGWPPGAEYYLEPGYRPIELTARAAPKPQILVHDLITPYDNNGQPQVRREPFGVLVEKHALSIYPLLSTRRMRIAARIKVVPRTMAKNYLQSIELLCFMARKDVPSFSISLLQYNVPLLNPPRYDPNQFEYAPPLEVPNLRNSYGMYNPMPYGQPNPYVQTNPFGQILPPYGSSHLMPNRGMVIQTREETEEERRKQMDKVYSDLPDGETLATTKVDEALITTPLMNHQMRALTFLLDHEKNKTFEKDGKDDNIISLWKAERKGERILYYKNVVTREKQTRSPKICRGAILADDMGLGKTLSTISLIATTHEEAREWSKKKILTDDQGEVLPDEEEDSDDSDVVAIDVPGAPKRAKIEHSTDGSKHANGKKKEGKREHKKKELERMKRDNIKVRSRATLVVLPLTLVSAWEEQIRLHWAPDKRPKIYVHHGHNRLKDPKKIARHNIVMTTYSTLASEYSILATHEDSDSEEDEKDDDEEEVVVTDENGNVIGRRLTAAEKAAAIKKKNSLNRKRKRKADKRKRLEKGEGFPLQQIEWFRIVLDEAHTIKESRTLQSRAACFLMARSRICLTGTPVQNRIQDLYALIKFLRLEPFDDPIVWNRFCASVDSKIGLEAAKRIKKAAEKEEPLDSTAMKCVQTIMKYLTLRRTKDMKMADGTKILELPPKYNRTVQLDFDPHERATYNEMRQQYKDDFEEMKKNDTLKYNYASILHEISNLRMTCDHIELVESNKDIRHRKEDPLNEDEDPDALIKREGISRDRAIRFFEVLCNSDKAECSMCHYDLSTFADESSRQESPIDDIGMGQGISEDQGSKKPVLTKCAHLLCTHCLERAINSGDQTMDNIDEETRIACPDCGTAIAALTEIRTLMPGDIEKDTKVKNVLTKETFGADIGIPVDKRSNQSTKIRALVEELETFSRSNRFSKLYDDNQPHLDQVAADATEKEMGYNDEVYVTQVGSPTKPIKSVVFSQWTSMLDRVARAVHRAGIKSATLDGRMKRFERNENLEKFQNDPSVEVFLISLKAGGVGLNLVSACRAYLLEPYWNPATENQGLDRVHRMGQLRPVITTKYIVSRSIEENMLELQRSKMELAESVSGKGRKLSREQELNILFNDDFSSRRRNNNAQASTSRITDAAAEDSNTESEGDRQDETKKEKEDDDDGA
jgi:SWI/SNF-related matrix-associated actin-dependent regulator of chromatin subfamily A3